MPRYLQVSAVSIWLPHGWAGITCFNAKLTRFVERYSNTNSRIVSDLRIYEHQILQNIMGKLTSLQAVSPASLFPLQESERGQTTSVISGRKCCEFYRRFNRVGSLQKTFADCLIGSREWYSSACALIWKMQGTKSGRLLFRLAPLARRTDATEFGLLPTPTAFTSKTEDLNKRNARMERIKAKGFSTWTEPLSILAIKGLLPTPTSSGREGYPTRARRKGHKKAMSYLVSNIQYRIGANSLLNPLFVAEMMGFPTDWLTSPFQNGATKPSRRWVTRLFRKWLTKFSKQ